MIRRWWNKKFSHSSSSDSQDNKENDTQESSSSISCSQSNPPNSLDPKRKYPEHSSPPDSLLPPSHKKLKLPNKYDTSNLYSNKIPTSNTTASFTERYSHTNQPTDTIDHSFYKRTPVSEYSLASLSQPKRSRSSLSRAQSVKNPTNPALLRTSIICNELTEWEMSMKQRRQRQASEPQSATNVVTSPKQDPKIPVSPRHLPLLRRQVGSPYRITKTRQVNSPKHDMVRASPIFSPSRQKSRQLKQDLRQMKMTLEQLVPSRLKEPGVRKRKISEQVQISEAVVSDQVDIGDAGNERMVEEQVITEPKEKHLLFEQTSQTAIKLSPKQTPHVSNDPTDSILEDEPTITDGQESEEFFCHFGNFSIQAPYDMTPGNSRMGSRVPTQPATPRKSTKQQKSIHISLKQAAKKLEEPVDSGPAASFSSRLINPIPSVFTELATPTNDNIFPDNTSTPLAKQPFKLGGVAPNLESSKKQTNPDQTKPETPTENGSSQPSLFDMFNKKQSSDTWSCSVCMIANANKYSNCQACETPNPNAVKEKPAVEMQKTEPFMASSGQTSLADMFKAKPSSDTWSCDVCMVGNKADAIKCVACETPNPNAPKQSKVTFAADPPSSVQTGPTFPSSSTSTPSQSTVPTFKFGTSASNTLSTLLKTDKEPKADPAPTFKFGTTNVIQPDQKPEPATKAPSFGGASSNFGQSKSASTTTPAPTFSFGVPASSDTTDGGKKPTFNYGYEKGNAGSDGNPSSVKTTPTFSFGGTSSKPDESKPSPAKKAPAFSFGGNSAKPDESKPSPAKTAPTFSFGGSTTKPGENKPSPAKIAPTFSFGGTSTKPEESKPAPFVFGGGGNTAKDAPHADQVKPAPFTFGANNPTSSTVNEPGKQAPFTFGSKTEAATPFKFTPTASGNASPFNGSQQGSPFGNNAKPASAASMFGPNSTSTTTTPFQFSAGSATTTPVTGSTMSFGQPQATSSQKPFQFGTTSTTDSTPSFQSTPKVPTTMTASPFFGSTVKTDAAPTTSPFVFASATTNAQPKQSNPFPKSESLFSNNNQTQAPTFNMSTSSPHTSTLFKSAAPPAAQPFNFGATSVPSAKPGAFVFGNSSTGTTSASAPFTFSSTPNMGSSASMTQQSAVPAPFQFGATDNSGAGQPENPFQFDGNKATAGRKIAKPRRRVKK